MAAQYGTAHFVGLRTRVTYTKDIYFDDSAGNPVRWDSGNGASSTSETSWTAPEAVILVDIVLAAASGQTKTSITRNGNPTGDMLRNALHLASVTTRPVLRIPFPAGAKIGGIQLA